MKELLTGEVDLNCELVMNTHMTNKLFKTQGDIDKSVKNECEDCESGRHVDNEVDIEEKPLLEYNSEGENEDSVSRRDGDWELTVPVKRRDIDRQSPLSDSSCECISHEAGSINEHNIGDRTGMKPFEMDFDIKSNRSSLVSQEDQVSPEEASSSLP